MQFLPHRNIFNGWNVLKCMRDGLSAAIVMSYNGNRSEIDSLEGLCVNVLMGGSEHAFSE